MNILIKEKKGKIKALKHICYKLFKWHLVEQLGGGRLI